MMSSSPLDITQPRDMPEVWHAFICLRYGLLMLLHIKPRPESMTTSVPAETQWDDHLTGQSPNDNRRLRTDDGRRAGK